MVIIADASYDSPGNFSTSMVVLAILVRRTIILTQHLWCHWRSCHLVLINFLVGNLIPYTRFQQNLDDDVEYLYLWRNSLPSGVFSSGIDSKYSSSIVIGLLKSGYRNQCSLQKIIATIKFLIKFYLEPTYN